jgi:hypothetical protein
MKCLNCGTEFSVEHERKYGFDIYTYICQTGCRVKVSFGDTWHSDEDRDEIKSASYFV